MNLTLPSFVVWCVLVREAIKPCMLSAPNATVVRRVPFDVNVRGSILHMEQSNVSLKHHQVLMLF